jgi:hypothetical protein
VSGFSGFVGEDSSSGLEVVVDRPGIPLGVLEDSRFNDFTRGMDRGLDDWFESVYSEDDWRSFESYLERNGFEVSDWTFSFSYEDAFYGLTVSPGIGYSSEVPVSNCFRPELDVHVEEVYGVEGASYDKTFFMDVDNPGLPEPVFRKLAEGLGNYSDHIITEGLRKEVY